MLVLSRKVGQSLKIGDDVEVYVVKLPGGRVTIGVQAPPHVRVVRGELKPVPKTLSSGDSEQSQHKTA